MMIELTLGQATMLVAIGGYMLILLISYGANRKWRE